MNESGLLTARGVTKVYKKEKNQIPVIRGVDFSMNTGEMVAITGASGVGKSTLLHILGGLEKPTSGEVLYGEKGQNLFKLSDRELSLFRNRSLGFVFQFHYLLPEFTALENVMMPALISGKAKSEAAHEARALLEFVGVAHRAEHRPAEMSGGEQQRVAIARSVILKPRLLLADELTGNLDSQNRNHVMELLARLNASTGISILVVTHDHEIAKRMHRILVMKDGVFVDSN